MFKIGNVEIKGKVVCAPMAGVTNKVFRKLVREQGAALTYTEMTSNVGLKYNSEKTIELAEITDEEYPVSLQIFGGSVEDYINGAKYFAENTKAAIIDINMGCPVQKVAIKSEAGSSLLKTPEKIKEIIEGVVKVIDKPLTVKIRIGWGEGERIHVEIAKLAEAAGAAAIAVHGRTRSQLYSGKADWNAIKEVKDAVKIPVIGNGDVDSPEAAKAMLDQTGVDAVMIAREAQDNPWIFKQCVQYLETGKYDPLPNFEETSKALIKYFEDLSSDKSERLALSQIRGVMSNWFKRFKGINEEKQLFVQADSWDEMLRLLEIMKTKAH